MTDKRVFLSYSLEDRETARDLVRAIEARGWAISWERYEEPDAIATLALREALNASDCVVVLWSTHSVDSTAVREEARAARERGVLVQATLDEAPVPMPFLLDGLLPVTDESSLTTLVRQIAHVLHDEAASPTPASTGQSPELGARRQARGTETDERYGSAETMSAVRFTLTGPPYVRAGDGFSVDVWAHRENQRAEVSERLRESFDSEAVGAGGAGPALSARVHIDGLDVETAEQSLRWDRGVGRTTFRVRTSADSARGSRTGFVGIYLVGLQIARIHLLVQIADETSQPEIIPSRQERHTRALACYALEDRDAVESRVRAFEKVAPGVEVNLEAVEHRNRDDGLSAFLEEISLHDVMYLFWSEHAAASTDVEREWRYALRLRGIDFIDPAPLVSPEAAPPPPELATFHRDEWRVVPEVGEAGRPEVKP